MSRKRLLTLAGIGLALIACVLAARVWSPALSAAAACRYQMERTEGYGPWRFQASQPLASAQPGDAVVTYFDGFNTASCHAQQYGPVWVVTGVGQTLVACGRGLGAAGDQGCPRGAYGVIP